LLGSCNDTELWFRKRKRRQTGQSRRLKKET
jgi:hypothetical protein